VVSDLSVSNLPPVMELLRIGEDTGKDQRRRD
jgi:hypothetical protein